jgi:phosphatidylglycerol lysyltransferase
MTTERRTIEWVRWRPWLLGLAALIMLGLLYEAVSSLLRTVSYRDVLAQIAKTSSTNLSLSVLMTALSFLALAGYDSSALRYVGVQVKRSTVLLTSFVAYALGNTIGIGILTGGAVRMRLYTAAGVEAGKVAQAIAFNAAAFGVGMVVLGAAGLAWGAAEVSDIIHFPIWLVRTLAILVLAAAAAFIILSMRGARELRIAGRWTVRLPPAGLAVKQLVISVIDLAASAAALWFLLPQGVVDLPGFVAFYAIAIAAGLISHVPGGLGIFEAIILLACGGRAPPEQILGALVLYRCVYYLLPLLLATTLLAVYELRAGIAVPLRNAAAAISPLLLSTLTFIAGSWLLISGVTPTTREAIELLSANVPLPIVEASHFIGSILGLAMLIIARGMLHRLDAAWWAALGLAIVAAILALPKGIALSEAGYLSSLALLLIFSRRHFDRPSSLFEHTLERGWLLAIAWIIVACVCVLFFVYRDVDYQHQLWWQFEFDADAPRSLRALMGVLLAGLGFSLWQLLRPAAGTPSLPQPAEIDQASAIIQQQPCADASLALVGDKHLLFSASGKAFVMYGRQARSWISLFDPVGPPQEWPELIWRMIEMAADHGGRAAFYQVRPQHLSAYLDAGLRAFKLGEYAFVPLTEFSIKGSKRANLRQGVNRAEREGLTFAVIEPQHVSAALVELNQVSNAWLREYNAREKGFSLGVFKEEYLVRQPIAVVRHRDHIVAFANVLCTQLKDEVSIDLMRHRPDAPYGTMDFLFVKLLQHYQGLGYQRFGLGMAPMSGMAKHELASRWHRFGRLLFDRGERFYNFRGLRSFKEKFDPVWEPRYLAAPSGFAPLLALTDVAALINSRRRATHKK